MEIREFHKQNTVWTLYNATVTTNGRFNLTFAVTGHKSHVAIDDVSLTPVFTTGMCFSSRLTHVS